jgi:hypothetical protein
MESCICVKCIGTNEKLALCLFYVLILTLRQLRRLMSHYCNCEYGHLSLKRQDHQYIFLDPDPTWKASHQHIRLATNMKFAGVNIYGHPNIWIWCADQHTLTTKKFFYLELKGNRQFYRLSTEESQSVFPRPLSVFPRPLSQMQSMKKNLH